MSPATSPATAGRKRKGGLVRPRTGCKRRRTPAPSQEEASGWASLPADIAHLVGCRLLAEDVVDYLTFRAVCSHWRASTSSPDRDSALGKPYLRPRYWVALCDGDAAPLDNACCEITFFQTRTARCLRVRLPELRSHRVVGFTDGLVILLHKRKSTVRVVHPFTRAMVDLPPLGPAFHKAVKDRGSLLRMSAFVCSSPSAPFSVVAHFPCHPVLLWTQPGRMVWNVIRHGMLFRGILPFQGMLFATVESTKQIAMVFPLLKFSPAYAPDSLANQNIWCQYLVELDGRMLLVVQHGTTEVDCCAFKIFEVDIRGQKLLSTCSLGDQALFLHTGRCLCVSTMNLPSICSNFVYFTMPRSPVVMQSLSTGLSENLSAMCQIHDMKEKIRPSVRPFTIVDHLLTYCHHLEWARGLMFHEYHRIPESFKELHDKIQAQCSQAPLPPPVATMERPNLNFYEAVMFDRYDILAPRRARLPAGFEVSYAGVPVAPLLWDNELAVQN
uniref:Uncharacterized protein n=1 Tax=Avena sativa TaxID=4498 RepID=A0ACD5YFW5_AVESA